MKAFVKMITTRARRFARDDAGSMLSEAVMILPVMIWCYLAFFVYWDSYRTVNMAQKAAYTASDLVSREMAPLNSSYLPGVKSLMTYLVGNRADVHLRLTSLVFNEGENDQDAQDADDSLQVAWSISPANEMEPWTNATISEVMDRIPKMADGDTVVLLETTMDYVPLFDVGMSERQINNFVVTRPRFLPKICLQDVEC